MCVLCACMSKVINNFLFFNNNERNLIYLYYWKVVMRRKLWLLCRIKEVLILKRLTAVSFLERSRVRVNIQVTFR